MIRDLTKSALSLSWACTLLGAKQAINLVQPGPQGQTNMFAPVAQAAADQLDGSMKGIYRSGGSLQSAMVDMAWSSLNPMTWFNPNTWGSIWKSAANQGASSNWTGPFTSATQSTQCCGQNPGMDPQNSMDNSGGGMPGTQETNSSAGWGPPMSRGQ